MLGERGEVLEGTHALHAEALVVLRDGGVADLNVEREQRERVRAVHQDRVDTELLQPGVHVDERLVVARGHAEDPRGVVLVGLAALAGHRGGLADLVQEVADVATADLALLDQPSQVVLVGLLVETVNALGLADGVEERGHALPAQVGHDTRQVVLDGLRRGVVSLHAGDELVELVGLGRRGGDRGGLELADLGHHRVGRVLGVSRKGVLAGHHLVDGLESGEHALVVAAVLDDRVGHGAVADHDQAVAVVLQGVEEVQNELLERRTLPGFALGALHQVLDASRAAQRLQEALVGHVGLRVGAVDGSLLGNADALAVGRCDCHLAAETRLQGGEFFGDEGVHLQQVAAVGGTVAEFLGENADLDQVGLDPLLHIFEHLSGLTVDLDLAAVKLGHFSVSS